MKAPHDVSDDLGALAMLDVGGEVLLPHRVEDAALNRLQAVADIRQRPRRNDRERVVEVARLRGLVEGYSDCTARAVAAATEQRRSNGGVTVRFLTFSGVDVVKE